MACLLVVFVLDPGAVGDRSAAGAVARVTAWVVMPSMLLTVMSGLLAIAVHPGFHDAGWAWLKAATGVVVVEGALHLMGTVQAGARPEAAGLARVVSAEVNTLWVLLAVSAANVALGVWRPRLPEIPV